MARKSRCLGDSVLGARCSGLVAVMPSRWTHPLGQCYSRAPSPESRAPLEVNGPVARSEASYVLWTTHAQADRHPVAESSATRRRITGQRVAVRSAARRDSRGTI